ncbi:MAG TPA: hypothetical protein VNS49_20025 [Streptomyces sp.]|nr:hypothetical protein [Streptomyces sp.]
MTDAVPDVGRQAPASPIRRVLPAPSVGGFVLLLAVLFGVSYTVGTLAGPVGSVMRPTEPTDGDSGVSETGEHGGTGGTHGMPAPSHGEAQQ